MHDLDFLLDCVYTHIYYTPPPGPPESLSSHLSQRHAKSRSYWLMEDDRYICTFVRNFASLLGYTG